MKITDTITADVTKCARCNKNHKRLVFKPFKQAVSEYTHWALCPRTKEPILLARVMEGDERIVRRKKEGRDVVRSKL